MWTYKNFFFRIGTYMAYKVVEESSVFVGIALSIRSILQQPSGVGVGALYEISR